MNHKTNLGIRAILYSARKWKKTLLVFCLLLAITTLVLSGLAIADAQEEQAEEVRGTTGASFTVERDISTGGWNGNYSTQEFMSEDMIQQIAAVDGIAGYDATLITTLIVVITAVSMVLIILILSMSIRSRKRETGILLAVGIAKPAVILQYVLETLLIAVVAFPLAYLSSKQIAGTLGTLFGKAAENVIVTPQHFMLVAIVGGVLLVAAVLVSSISTMRLKPKQILAQME